jgi:tetratricopeptide (TPR) repeat protein
MFINILIPLILIVIALFIIFFIIIKKFPALAILDVKQVDEEKESKFKKKIIKQRLERDLSKFSNYFFYIWKKISYFLNNFLFKNYQRLKEIRNEYKIRHKRIDPVDRVSRINKLFLLVEDSIKEENWLKAEEALIEIVSLEAKNIKAFFELAKIYYETKKFDQAKDTWEYLLKLIKKLDSDELKVSIVNVQEVRYNLAKTYNQLDNLSLAFEYINQALDIEPRNPRYLDLIFDLSIMKKDKKLANEYFERLVEVNPENQKLIELRDKIKELEAKNEKDD